MYILTIIYILYLTIRQLRVVVKCDACPSQQILFYQVHGWRSLWFKFRDDCFAGGCWWRRRKPEGHLQATLHTGTGTRPYFQAAALSVPCKTMVYYNGPLYVMPLWAQITCSEHNRMYWTQAENCTFQATCDMPEQIPVTTCRCLAKIPVMGYSFIKK